jgi:hypothetical protein
MIAAKARKIPPGAKSAIVRVTGCNVTLLSATQEILSESSLLYAGTKD